MFKQRIVNVWSQISTNMGNFHRLEIVGRASETQLQVGELFFDVVLEGL